MAFDIYPGSPSYIFDSPKTLDIYELIYVNLCIWSHLRKQRTKVTYRKGDTGHFFKFRILLYSNCTQTYMSNCL